MGVVQDFVKFLAELGHDVGFRAVTFSCPLHDVVLNEELRLSLDISPSHTGLTRFSVGS